MTEDRVPADPTTEAAVGSFTAAMRTLFGSLADSEWTDTPGLVLYSSGLLLPRFNGVVVLGADADEGTAVAWLDELVFRGLPHAVLSRPAAPVWVAPLASTSPPPHGCSPRASRRRWGCSHRSSPPSCSRSPG